MSYDDIAIAPISKTLTNEYTIELWVYLYLYVTTTISFTSYDIVWDKHIRISITSTTNLLFVNCYPFSNTLDLTLFPEKLSVSIVNRQWTSIRCGADLNIKKFFLDPTETAITTDPTTFPNLSSVGNVDLKFTHPSTVTNTGILFLREIKLWQLYNPKYANTNRK